MSEVVVQREVKANYFLFFLLAPMLRFKAGCAADRSKATCITLKMTPTTLFPTCLSQSESPNLVDHPAVSPFFLLPRPFNYLPFAIQGVILTGISPHHYTAGSSPRGEPGIRGAVLRVI